MAASQALQLALLLITLLQAHGRAPSFIDKVNHVVSSYRLARDLVDSRWNDTWSLELPCATPRVNGFVSKIATGSQSPTLSMSIAEAEQFRFERLPIYSGCQVHVSHKWKFIFVRQPKSSSTAVLVAIKEQLCGIKNAKHADKCKHDEFTEARAHLPIKIWNEYFVFTVVRNPWVRMLSAYNMFNKLFLHKRAGMDGSQKGAHCGTSFLSYSENTNSLRQLCPGEGCCSYIPTIRQFVPHFVDQHINDQAHCVFLPGGESLVDFIGSTATIEEDWPRILGEINRRAGTAFVAQPVTNPNGRGATSSRVETDCMLPEVRAMFNETTLHNIARQYAMDIVRYSFM